MYQFICHKIFGPAEPYFTRDAPDPPDLYTYSIFSLIVHQWANGPKWTIIDIEIVVLDK